MLHSPEQQFVHFKKRIRKCSFNNRVVSIFNFRDFLSVRIRLTFWRVEHICIILHAISQKTAVKLRKITGKFKFKGTANAKPVKAHFNCQFCHIVTAEGFFLDTKSGKIRCTVTNCCTLISKSTAAN